MREHKKAKVAYEMRAQMRHGRGRSRIAGKMEFKGEDNNIGRILTVMRKLCKDRTEWQKWIELGYPDA